MLLMQILRLVDEMHHSVLQPSFLHGVVGTAAAIADWGGMLYALCSSLRHSAPLPFAAQQCFLLSSLATQTVDKCASALPLQSVACSLVCPGES